MKQKSKIMVVCATERDKRELSSVYFRDVYDIAFYNDNDSELYEKILCKDPGWLDYNVDPEKQIEQAKYFYQQYDCDGVIVSEDYPGSVIASIISKECELIGPSSESILACHHKYVSRKSQQKLVPEVTPKFCLLDDEKNQMKYPFFVKPVKCFFSFFADVVCTESDLYRYQSNLVVPHAFVDKFNWFINRYASFENISCAMIVEELLTGRQYTYEGVIHNGIVQMIGVVSSIMFPGTISFSRFEYPSSLSKSVQIRMHEVAQKFVTGIDLDNMLFNIEFMFDDTTDILRIIEINPRMASQFADMYEKVDGTNSYQYAIDVALGKKPVIQKNKGNHNFAASCVLRLFEDKKVIKTPTQKEIERFYQEFSDGRLQCFVREGQYLSDVFQDGKSFRYGLIHLGARDRQELLEKFEYAQSILNFGLR